jgi:nitroreductase
MDLLEAIKNRRSIRKYKNDAVDDKVLESVLDAARLAPSWANTQCWKFIVIRDTEIKAKIADALLLNPIIGSNPAVNALKMAPVAIVAIAEKQVSGYFNGKSATVKGENWYLYDLGVAMENLVLAATAAGLGTVHIGLFEDQKVAALLQIPDNYEVVAMTPLGYPEFQPNQRPRKTLNEIVFKEKFGQF